MPHTVLPVPEPLPAAPRRFPCLHGCGRSSMRPRHACCLFCHWHQTQPGEQPRHSWYCDQRAARIVLGSDDVLPALEEP